MDNKKVLFLKHAIANIVIVIFALLLSLFAWVVFSLMIPEEAAAARASWYDYSLKGYPNYSKTAYTAASRVHARGTCLLVCTSAKANLEPVYSPYNAQCVVVRVNDYGPEPCDWNKPARVRACPERAIDLSSRAFRDLRPLAHGLVEVSISTTTCQ